MKVSDAGRADLGFAGFAGTASLRASRMHIAAVQCLSPDQTLTDGAFSRSETVLSLLLSLIIQALTIRFFAATSPMSAVGKIRKPPGVSCQGQDPLILEGRRQSRFENER
jgi:hypothetical protein